MITIKEENIPFDSKRNEKRPYMYLTKHGIGPGTLPRDVKLVKWEDIDDYYTALWLDRPLSTKELDYYGIIPETRNMDLLKRLGREDLFGENLKEYVYDDDEDIDDGDVVYEARAYYGKNFSGLAHSEDFYDASELRDWIWSMCQDGFYVEVKDLEDGTWTRYAWLDDGGTDTFEPMSVDDLIIWTNA